MSIVPLPRPASPSTTVYRDFLVALQAAGFAGEIRADHANRTVQATDNSIYQRLPQAVICPAHADDVQLLARLLAEPAHRDVAVAARGGGTGTNGQSLTDGIVVDLSRNMNRILEINAQARWVRVEAGVVKDQLNAALKPHGLFFAPELSTSNRATVGGMINTDASGQGSCTYGKTRDHVLELDFVLMGGERLHSDALDEAELERRCARQDRVGKVYRTARRIRDDKAALIDAKFPKLNRCLTGYDLAHLREADGRFNLNSVLCGAEGSLGFVVEAKLNVLPIPKFSVLVNVRYAGFMDALRDARALLEHRPLSIETVDSKVLMLAMKDFVWSSVAEYFPQDDARPTLGINLIEFSGDDEHDVDAQVRAFVEHLRTDTSVERLGHTLAAGDDAVKRVYAMRKRAVGLLGNVQGEARPQPFVEDTAVPPENLAAYIAEFRALLDGHGLQYGMFGHVDAGVLHVRPALDMKDPKQAALVRPVSDAVAELTQRHGGLLWGEHGKGVRSEYAPAFFGELYPSLQQLKAAFDPHNQFNPGKIATPPAPTLRLLKIDEVPTRGDHDRQIDERVWQSYGTAMHCNGNGACYNFDPDDAMCPSWKATRERVQSPKGRASLMREWLRLQGQAGVDVVAAARTRQPLLRGLAERWRNSRNARRRDADFSHEVYDAMAGCLACKSCAGQCPVKVNVPEFRSRFLELYHQRYLRPLRDYLIGSLEFTMPWMARVPALYNGLMGANWVRTLLERQVGMVDSPLLSRFDLAAVIRAWNVKPADPHALAALSEAQRAQRRHRAGHVHALFRYRATGDADRAGGARRFPGVARAARAERQGAARAGLSSRIREGGDPQRDATGRTGALGRRAGRSRSGDDADVSAGIPEGDGARRCADRRAAAGVAAGRVAGSRCGQGDGFISVAAALHREDQCAGQRQAMGAGVRASRVALAGSGDRVLRDVGHVRARGAQSRDVEDDLCAVVGRARRRAGAGGRGAGDRVFVSQPGETPVVEAGAPSVAGAARSCACGRVMR